MNVTSLPKYAGLVLASALFAIGATSANAQNLISNGDFTTAGSGFSVPTTYEYLSATVGSPLAGWSATTANQDYWVSIGASPFGVPYQGDTADGDTYSVYIPNSQSLTQTGIALTAGKTYTLSFYMGYGSNSTTTNATASLTAFFNGTAIGTPATISTDGTGKLFSYNFTAPSTEPGTLTFTNSTTGATQNDVIDHVSITAAAPEPDSFVLLGSGVFCALGIVVRKRISR